MGGKKKIALLALFALLTSITAVSAQAHPLVVIKKVGQEVFETATRNGAQKMTKQVAELGGDAMAKSVAERALREGGEETLAHLVQISRNLGRDAVRAADNAYHIPGLFKAVGELPTNMQASAIRRLGAGREGKALAELVERHGSSALLAELKHPGTGSFLVSRLGDDGAELALRANSAQALAIARHSDDIAKLPTGQKDKVLEFLKNNFDDMTSFMGRFIEQNPGKVLFTITATPIIMANSERIFGSTVGMAESLDGRPFHDQGILMGLAEKIITMITPIFLLFGVGWVSIKLFFNYRLSRAAYSLKESELHQKSSNFTKKKPDRTH